MSHKRVARHSATLFPYLLAKTLQRDPITVSINRPTECAATPDGKRVFQTGPTTTAIAPSLVLLCHDNRLQTTRSTNMIRDSSYNLKFSVRVSTSRKLWFNVGQPHLEERSLCDQPAPSKAHQPALAPTMQRPKNHATCTVVPTDRCVLCKHGSAGILQRRKLHPNEVLQCAKSTSRELISRALQHLDCGKYLEPLSLLFNCSCWWLDM